MRTILVTVLAAGAFGAALFIAEAAEKKVKMQDLPAAVRQAITEHSKGATIKGLATEVEDGKTVYEAELMVEGHSKDITFDAQGNVLDLEEQVAIDQIPAPARAALERAAGKGTIRLVERVTEAGKTAYEAQIANGGKTSEVVVGADGKPVK